MSSKGKKRSPRESRKEKILRQPAPKGRRQPPHAPAAVARRHRNSHGENLSKTSGKQKPRKRRIQTGSREAQHTTSRNVFAETIGRAKEGDIEAVKNLVLFADVVITALSDLAETRPDLLKPLAQERLSWPAWISRKKFYRDTNEMLMDRIDLNQCGLFSNRKWQPRSITSQTAYWLYVVYLGACPRPRHALTRKAKRKWFDALWKAARKDGWRPEHRRGLFALGKCRIGKKATNRGMSDQTPGMRVNDVQDKIKDQIWSAFDSLFASVEDPVVISSTGRDACS